MALAPGSGATGAVTSPKLPPTEPSASTDLSDPRHTTPTEPHPTTPHQHKHHPQTANAARGATAGNTRMAQRVKIHSDRAVTKPTGRSVINNVCRHCPVTVMRTGSLLIDTQRDWISPNVSEPSGWSH